MKPDTAPLMKAIERYLSKADEDLEEQLKAEGYVSTGAAVKAINVIEEEVTEAIQERVDAILSELNISADIKSFLSDKWTDMQDRQELVDTLHDLFKSQFDDLMHTCTVDWIISMDPELVVSDDRITKYSEDFIRTWSPELARIMNLNTNASIERVLIQADQDGQTIEEVAQAIADSGIRECGYRARRVALTEVLRVEEYAHQEGRVQNPSCYKKRWVETYEAEEPRSNHIAISGQEVFKRERFTLVGADGATYRPMCPRDTCLPAKESVNCHCITEDICDDKVLGMTIEEKLALRQKYMDEVDAEYEAKLAQFYADGHTENNTDYETYISYFE